MHLAAAAPPAGPVDPVLRLYRDFAWQVLIDAPEAGPAFLAQPDAVWSRYFSPQLVKLLRRDRQCAARTHEICRIDFDPIWASQDPGAARMKITAGSAPATVDVSFDDPGNGERIGLKFLLVRRGADWRIDDIHYANGSRLRVILGPHE